MTEFLNYSAGILFFIALFLPGIEGTTLAILSFTLIYLRLNGKTQ